MNIRKPSAIGALLVLSLAANAYCVWRITNIEGTHPFNRNSSMKELTSSEIWADSKIQQIDQAIGIGDYDIGLESDKSLDERVKALEEKTEELDRRLGY